jgi:hypothetical protein
MENQRYTIKIHLSLGYTWIKHKISRVQTLRVPHDDQDDRSDDLGGRRVSGFRDPTNVTEFLQFSMNQMGKFYIFLSEMDSC